MKKLVLLSLLYYSVIWIKPSYAQPILHIKGAKDSLAVKNQLVQLLDLLDIHETVHITVIFTSGLPDKTHGLTIQIQSDEPEAYQIIRVWISKHLSKLRYQLVLAHEMIHVKQYVKSELSVVDEHHLYWKGHIYAYMREKDFEYSPWEHEAYRKDDDLAQLCTEQSVTPLYAVKPKP